MGTGLGAVCGGIPVVVVVAETALAALGRRAGVRAIPGPEVSPIWIRTGRVTKVSRQSTPSTIMPLRPTALTLQPRPSGTTSRCLRETTGWTTCTSHSWERPTVKAVVNCWAGWEPWADSEETIRPLAADGCAGF